MAYQSPLFNYGAFLSGGADGLDSAADDVVDESYTCSMCLNSYQKGECDEGRPRPRRTTGRTPQGGVEVGTVVGAPPRG
ncbi:hypothetical protein ONE63_005642 [Megalurothrips usitatus]|uniref:Uncharacterized protein n=1 Tax=Megalurothrips usitatus TaxID=439358 RepID=A0AAV7XZD1_9NEOP|nr:hypothetical protein ONE63_005642 [Megalurothrips usitatus]